MNIIKEWIGKQQHLPQNIDENKLENFLLKNKFHMEKTKQKIENYFTLRGLHRELFATFDIDSEEIRRFRKCQVYVPMPLLTDKQERIMVYKLIDSDPALFSFTDLAIFLLAIVDISLKYDYAVGERLVHDWSGIEMGHFPKLDFSVLTKLNKLHQEAYSSRILGLEYINCPPFIDNILGLLKPIFKAKLFNRITVHKSFDTLYENVPKKYLPVDFGGEQKSVEVIKEEWMEELKHQAVYLEESGKLVSDESKRIKKLNDGGLFGVDGTFKKLNID